MQKEVRMVEFVIKAKTKAISEIKSEKGGQESLKKEKDREENISGITAEYKTRQEPPS